MSLLRQIQDATVDPKFQVVDILRMCKILATRLNNREFHNWIDKELNGYDSLDNLPDYRILENLSCCGDFFGGFGSRLINASIPLANIPEYFRGSASKRYIKLSISALENNVSQARQHNSLILRDIWPADLIVELNHIVFEGMSCGQAWTVIPTSAFVTILDIVKNRVLDFTFAIETEVPNIGEIKPGNELIHEKTVNIIFEQCILNHNNQTAFPGAIIKTHNKGVNMSENNPIKIQAGHDVSGVIGSEVSGVVAGGDISGSVSNTINQLRSLDTLEASQLADKLVQLQAVIENEPTLSIEDKDEALTQIKALGEAGQNPKEGKIQQAAKGAIRMLKGLATELPTATVVFHELNHLLPEIAHLLGL